jgi:hypothetical protein
MTMLFIRLRNDQTTHIVEEGGDHRYRSVCGECLPMSSEVSTTLRPGRTLCLACRTAKSRTGELRTKAAYRPIDCYCSTPELQVISDVNAVAVPADALVERHCWKRVCQVRGLHFGEVDAQSWSELCAKRGYLLRRYDRY